jgi:polyisoprenoid-binding protein YceI
VTYEVGETFFREGNVFAVAVGTTQGVSGDIQLNFDQPQESQVGPLTVDISGLRSDSARRDSAIQGRFLQSAQYPTVVFNPTVIEGLPETIEAGVDYTFTMEGDLTIRDTTQPAVFEVTATLEGDTLAGQASTAFLMSDFGFGPIDILGMLKTEDEVKILVEFTASA